MFIAFGHGVVLDHEPRWWERIWLRFAMLFRRRSVQRPPDDRIEPSWPPGPDTDGPAGAGDRVPRRPPDAPLAGAVALAGRRSADGSDVQTGGGVGGGRRRSRGWPSPDV